MARTQRPDVITLDVLMPGMDGWEVLAALRDDRFAGPVCLEWEKLWHPYLPSLDVALATAAARGWW